MKKHASGKPCPPAITLQDAFTFIREDRQNFLHSPLIEAEALYRLQRYPKQIEESMHRSLTTIPRKLAYILHKKASYISPAVEAFYLRDPISLRSLQVHDKQMLIFPPDDLVTVSVKYTKVGYAQMRSQQFTAPLAWVSHLSAESDAKKFGRIEMGMKVTSGFEMLLSDPCNIDNATVREIQMLLEDLKADEDHLPSDFDIQGWGHKDDNEGWLDINFRDFENEISRKGETGAKRTAEGFGDKNTQETLRKMVSRFEDFLNDDKAGVDGAESSNFSDDMDHDNHDGDDDDSNSTSNGTNNDSEDQEISFDEDQFTKSMREMMGMPADTATQADAVRGGNMNSINENDEGIEIYQDMQAMEAELKDAGALHNYSKPNSNKAAQHKPSPIFKTQSHGSSSLSSVGVSDTEDVDIDFNLVENLMESFKSQNGAAGPGGNLMGLMGTRLPRDDGEYS